MDDRIRLKDQLKFFLERCGMNASELARKSGVPKQSLSDWLAGAQPRKLEHLKRVADLLGVTIDHLCFGPASQGETPRQKTILVTGEWVEGAFQVQGKVRKVNQ